MLETKKIVQMDTTTDLATKDKVLRFAAAVVAGNGGGETRQRGVISRG